MFEFISPLVDSAIDGYSTAILVYGQTGMKNAMKLNAIVTNDTNINLHLIFGLGSGKTFTMLGSDTKPGIIPRAINYMFQKFRKFAEFDSTMEISMLELYKDNTYDLLSHLTTPISSDQLTKHAVRSEWDGLKILNKGIDKRTTGETVGNTASSRSHLITQFHIKGKLGEKRSTTMTFVDLAGSEDTKTTENMDETKAIHKSLSALNGVFANLKKKLPVDYNSNPLTKFLKPNFIDQSKTLLIINMSTNQEDIHSTISTARLATL